MSSLECPRPIHPPPRHFRTPPPNPKAQKNPFKNRSKNSSSYTTFPPLPHPLRTQRHRRIHSKTAQLRTDCPPQGPTQPNQRTVIEANDISPPRPPTMLRPKRFRCTRSARRAPRRQCPPGAHTQRAVLGWAGHAPTEPSIFIYSKQGEPSPAQKNLLRTRRKLSSCMRWALNTCPLRS